MEGIGVSALSVLRNHVIGDGLKPWIIAINGNTMSVASLPTVQS